MNMAVTVKSDNFVVTIPDKCYKTLKNLRSNYDEGLITGDELYLRFRSLMESLDNWLTEKVIGLGHGTEDRGVPINIVRWDHNKVTLQVTDDPFGCFWTRFVIDHISDQYRFGGLLERWDNDP